MPTWLSWVRAHHPLFWPRRRSPSRLVTSGRDAWRSLLALSRMPAWARERDCHDRRKEPKVTTDPSSATTDGPGRKRRRTAMRKRTTEKLNQAVEIKTSAPARSTSRSRSTAPTSTSTSTRNTRSWSAIRGPRLSPGKAPRKIVVRKFKKEVQRPGQGPRSCSPASNSSPTTTTSPRSARPTSTRPSSRSPTRADFIYEFEVEVRPAVRPAQLQGPQAQTAGQDLHRCRRREGTEPHPGPLRPDRAQGRATPRSAISSSPT